jgi:hypothetical protein
MPNSIFGMLSMTGFITDSRTFTMLPSLAPYRVMLAVPLRSHDFSFTLSGWDTLSRMASDKAVASLARIPRLLPVERQVWS